MGVTGFTKFYRNCMVERNLSEFKGSVVVIDAIYQIYKYCIAIRNSGDDMVNSQGKMKSHLFAIFNFSTYLLRNGLVPVYIFDGRSPDLKRETLSMRKKRKVQAMEDCYELHHDDSLNSNISSDDDEYIKSFKKSFKVEDIHYLECQALLTAMGIPWFQAPEEADSQCAALSNLKEVCGVISEDSDILVFGGKKLFKQLSPKKKTLQEISLESVLEEMKNKANIYYQNNNICTRVNEFKYNDFINFSILMGCDYNQSLNIDYDLLFEIFTIKNFDVEATISYLKKNDILMDSETFNSIAYLERFEKIREYYSDAKVISPNKINMHLNKCNRSDIIRMMCYENDFDFRMINSMVDEIETVYHAINALEKTSQSNGQWFKSFKSYQLKYHKANYKNNLKNNNFETNNKKTYNCSFVNNDDSFKNAFSNYQRCCQKIY